MRRALTPYLVLVVATLLILLVAPQTGEADSGVVNRAGGERERIRVALQADNTPESGGVTTLTFDATPLLPAPDLRVRWVVPEGVELLGGEAELSLGAVEVQETVRVQRQVRFPKAGTYRIAVEAAYEPNDAIRAGAANVLFFTIDARGSRVSERDPDARSPMGSIVPGEITVEVDDAARAPNGDPCFDISGSLTRIEKTASPTGYQPDALVPMRTALVTVREEDTLFDDEYGVVQVGADGSFTFPRFCDDDGFLNDTLELYIHIRAEAWLQTSNNSYRVAEVEDIGIIDETYEFKSATQDSDGGNLRFDLQFNEPQSAVLNILDALYDATKNFWDLSGTVPPEAEAGWERGEGEAGSFHDNFWNDLTIADAAGDPDEWDDSVIIHEYGHRLDDELSCDENPGGPHNVNAQLDPELAWGEGYGDYMQSAVRDMRGSPFSQWYLDIGGAGSGFGVNLETVMGQTTAGGTITIPNTIGNEMAVASALWDLYDPSPAQDDGQDRVGYGHGRIQGVFLNDVFEEMDNCNWDTYERAWMQLGNPADGPTAAAIVQNVGETELDGTPLVQTAQAASLQSPSAPAAPSAGMAGDSDWWNKVVSVVDTSASMAGPKFEAVKTVLREQVNDLAALPEGTELSLETFDNTSLDNRTLFTGRFFPNDVLPTIDALSTSGAADGFCPINGLNALSNAIEDRRDHHAWLFTDGIQYGFPGAETMRQSLAQRNVRASIALLGLCPGFAAREAQAPNGVLAQPQGIAKAYLGLAADETPGGLVPYLITAIASGGQFLFVDGSQAENAADILRAQITHSAGAGRWSDYVSIDHTYRFDRLTSWEYEWRDPISPDVFVDPAPQGTETIELPQPFPFYGSNDNTTISIFQNGYITIEGSPNFSGDADYPNNREVPDPSPPPDYQSWPNRALYGYWDDLRVVVPPRSSEARQAPQGLYGTVTGKRHGDWYAITYGGFRAAAGSGDLTFQMLLHLTTGEIRYQYLSVPSNGAGSATIGLEGNSGFGSSQGLQVSYNDVSGAIANQGYKFTPAPPQPTKTYNVAVDSMMEGVAFLLTGYDGSFAPLVVRDPAGTAIVCNEEAGALCLNLGLVQYVQVNTNGRVGNWTAEVGAGPTGSGTFSFTSFAASELEVRTQGDHSLSSVLFPGIPQPLLVDLGQPVDNNQLSGYFLTPTGGIFSGGFEMHDDGQHGDGAAGDGVFGILDFTPTGAGTAYMGVQGEVDGEPFTRFDPAPFTFNPMRLFMTTSADNFGAQTTLNVSLQNQDSVRHCYTFTYQLPEGWTSNQILAACVEPGAFHNAPFDVWMQPNPSTGNNTQPSGAAGTVTVTATEAERGIMSDSHSLVITRRRDPATLDVITSASWLRPGGDTARLEITVLDEQNTAVADGTQVELSTTTGSVTPTLGFVRGGYLYADFTSGPTPGTAVITARTSNGGIVTEGTATIEIRAATTSDLTLVVAPNPLPYGTDALSQLTVTVRDEAGQPVAGRAIRIGAEDDGQWLLIDGSEVITGTTDANGRIVATVRRRPDGATYQGTIGIRAELLNLPGEPPPPPPPPPVEGEPQPVVNDVEREARVLLRLGEEADRQLYLPLVQRP